MRPTRASGQRLARQPRRSPERGTSRLEPADNGKVLHRTVTQELIRSQKLAPAPSGFAEIVPPVPWSLRSFRAREGEDEDGRTRPHNYLALRPSARTIRHNYNLLEATTTSWRQRHAMRRSRRLLFPLVLFLSMLASPALAQGVRATFPGANNQQLDLNLPGIEGNGSWGVGTITALNNIQLPGPLPVLWQRDNEDRVLVWFLGAWLLAFDNMSKDPPPAGGDALLNDTPAPGLPTPGTWVPTN